MPMNIRSELNQVEGHLSAADMKIKMGSDAWELKEAVKKLAGVVRQLSQEVEGLISSQSGRRG